MQPPVFVPVLPVQTVEHQLPVLGHLVELDGVGGSTLPSALHERRKTSKSDVGKADSACSSSVWPERIWRYTQIAACYIYTYMICTFTWLTNVWNPEGSPLTKALSRSTI